MNHIPNHKKIPMRISTAGEEELLAGMMSRVNLGVRGDRRVHTLRKFNNVCVREERWRHLERKGLNHFFLI